MANSNNKKSSIWTPANIVTCVRIFFIPIFMMFAMVPAEGGYGFDSFTCALIALVTYMALSFTDKLDGWLARSRNEVTTFGKFLDPIADKLLVFSALLIFLGNNQIGVWAVFIILTREFLVSALRMVVSSAGTVVAAGNLGKAKTAVTMIAIIGYLAVPVCEVLLPSVAAMLLTISESLMLAAIVLTVISGFEYFWNARSILFDGE